tara:strand:+ start:1825 stop:3414 length:1590 start_codon:yes stop_codon:yes gene_type:complete
MNFGSPRGNLPTTLSKDFSHSPSANIQRSVFNRDHGLKTTFNAGELVPIFYDEYLPGDTFQMEAHGFARLATPIHPFMDNMYLQTFFFAVPFRILWENFSKFMGEQVNPGDSIDYLVPQITSTNVPEGSLFDYFGLPTKVAGLDFNNWAGRAYNKIYNEWFRDENLQDSVTVNMDDGPDDIADYTILKRGKRHDYFTSALPWPQKGDSVTIPMGTTAPVLGIGPTTGASYNNAGSAYMQSDGNAGTGSNWMSSGTNSIGVQEGSSSGVPNIYADLSSAVGTTINQLRESFQIQSFLERSARGGTRYKEIIQSMFNVTSPDMRLDRPEYLGGGRTRIDVNPVPQTSSTDTTTPQGNLSGYGYTGFTNHAFNKSFTEHGCIIGLMCAYADLTYQQGLDRFFSKQTRYDYYWPAFSHLGEQAILNKEIYAQGTSADDETFGYQERYAEYRYKPSRITGKMRSNATGTLDSWHLAQNFGSLPALNASFIQENPPVDRVTAVADEPNMLLDMFFKLKTARPMPTYSVPFSLGKF